MANNDSNEYSTYGGNSQRKGNSLENVTDRSQENTDGENENDQGSVNQMAVEYVRQLLAEKMLIDQSKMPNATRLIDAEIKKVQQMGRPPPREYKYVDVFRDKPIKVAAKVIVPVKEFPKFNFVGKLLGPKGNTFRCLQEETMCRMSILGRGSKKNSAQEEELRRSLDPKYAHLSDELHVEVTSLAPPAEAHARVAFALSEIKKYLSPDKNDFISLQQMRDMERLTGSSAGHAEDPTRLIRRPNFPRPEAPPARAETRNPGFSSRPVIPPSHRPNVSILSKIKASREEDYGSEDVDDSAAYESSFRPKTYLANEQESFYKRRPANPSAEASSTSTSWTRPTFAPGGSRPSSESRFRMAPYTRPQNEGSW